MPEKPATQPASAATPIDKFSQCHAGILLQLEEFRQLPALLAPMPRARQIAERLSEFFRTTAFQHHHDEEQELFPAVLAASQEGEERTHVQMLVTALTREHREIEKQWRALAPEIDKLAAGHMAAIDSYAVRDLIDQYNTHARFEEMEFLPLSEQILGRQNEHPANLGLTLHMRRRPQPPVDI